MGCLGCLGRVEPNEGSNHRKWPRLELFTQTFAQKDSVFEESLNTRQCDGKCFSPTQNENVERSSLSLNSELAVQDVIQESVPLGESWCIRGGCPCLFPGSFHLQTEDMVGGVCCGRFAVLLGLSSATVGSRGNI